MPKKEINYQNTIIYKIICKDMNIKDVYVGHTTNFIQRKNSHKQDSNSNTYSTKIYDTINKNGGWKNWDMIEIEKYPCKDGNEAKARERYWFEQLNSSLNASLTIIFEDEVQDKIKEKSRKYRERHGHKVEYRLNKSENQRIYRELNREKINQRKREAYQQKTKK